MRALPDLARGGYNGRALTIKRDLSTHTDHNPLDIALRQRPPYTLPCSCAYRLTVWDRSCSLQSAATVVQHDGLLLAVEL